MDDFLAFPVDVGSEPHKNPNVLVTSLLLYSSLSLQFFLNFFFYVFWHI